MIILDTSAAISLSITELLGKTLENHSVHTTEQVVNELKEISQEEDYLAEAAATILEKQGKITLHSTDFERFQTSRIDSGEASCLALTREIEADFILTDDLHAMAEIRKLSTTEAAISPTILQAMVENNTLTKEEAMDKIDQLAETRSWLGTPIYKKAKKQVEENL